MAGGGWRVQEDGLTDGVTIRRRPPGGLGKHGCGSEFDFVVPDIDNQPNNILEEIVWHKNVELEKVPPPPAVSFPTLAAAGWRAA